MPDTAPENNDKIAALEARIAFLESWNQVPAQYLPGYVAPEPVSLEPEPVAENAEANS